MARKTASMRAEANLGVQRCACPWCQRTYLIDTDRLEAEKPMWRERWASGGAYYPRWCGCERRNGKERRA